jgi:anti-anti-sigma regulatory factor
MDATGDDCRITELDVAGWFVVVADGSVATSACSQLEALVRPRLMAGGSVALDLRGTVTDSAAVLASLHSLTTAAAESGAAMVVVSASATVRDQLHAAGFPEVYESLDAAVADTQPVLRVAGTPDPEPALHSAAGDALLPSQQPGPVGRGPDGDVLLP